MLKSKYKWQLLEENEIKTRDELLQVLLRNRNVENAELFFSQDGSFYDPFLFNEMHKTIERIRLAIDEQEKIMLYGDYDVDGVTGTAILYRTIKKLGGNVSFYIPNRFTEGYGPNMARFREFVENGYTLIITVDNGITGVDEGNFLKSHGVDFIITDHHECQEKIPDAYSIIHPKLSYESYPFKDLSGCGVSFKVSHALLGYFPSEYVDLACLGTYADIVSAVDENRSILKWGLKQLTNTKNIGLMKLMEITKLKAIDEFALGFVFGPRLNAPGRMGSASDAVELLITEDEIKATQIALEIEKVNKDRKIAIDVILQEAIDQIEENHYDQNNVIVVAKEDWHEGVLGIVANKLVELYGKPAIVLAENDNSFKGSCRTLSDFPLFENLSQCSDLLEKFGGHKMAAGLQIAKDNLGLFRKKLHDLASSELCNILNIDCIPNEKTISTQLTKELELFRPFGPSNERPLFLLKDYKIINITTMGSKNNHIRLILKKEELTLTAVAFNRGEYFTRLNENDMIDVVGTFEINEYNGKITNQFHITDLCCREVQIFDYRSKAFVVENEFEYDFIYFENPYGYKNAKYYQSNQKIKNLVLVDLPKSVQDFKALIVESEVENLYLLLRCDDLFSSEHLLTREKMGRFYQLLKTFQTVRKNNERFQSQAMHLGFDKKLQNIAIQVFFELNFVIIESDEIKIVDTPEKRSLTESKTFNVVNESIQLKEKLLLSSTTELKEFILKLSMEDKNEY